MKPSWAFDMTPEPDFAYHRIVRDAGGTERRSRMQTGFSLRLGRPPVSKL